MPTAAAYSRLFVLKSVRPRRAPPTPAFGGTVPIFPTGHTWLPPMAAVWHGDLLTAWILHILAARGLVPSIYFYIYVLSPQLTASSPGRRGGFCRKYRLLLLLAILLLRVASVSCCCFLHPLSSSEAALGNEQGICESETRDSVPALSVISWVALDKLPNLSEPHTPHLTKNEDNTYLMGLV